MSAPGWDKFWKGQKRSFYAVMKIATGYFTSQLIKREYIKPGHAILDFGCGPGFVADDMAGKGVYLWGFDINPYFIEECRRNHPAFTFIEITTDTVANSRLLKEQAGRAAFDHIILLSVIQYLPDTVELHRITQMLAPYLAEGGQIIIADVIDENTSSVRDAWAVFVQCLKKGKLFAFTGFIAYLLFSDYRKVSKKADLLKVPQQAIMDMAANLGLHCKEVPGLTLHPTRKNYLLVHPNR